MSEEKYQALALSCQKKSCSDAVEIVDKELSNSSKNECDEFIIQLAKFPDFKLLEFAAGLFAAELKRQDATTALRGNSLAKYLFAYLAKNSFARDLLSNLKKASEGLIDFETFISNLLVQQDTCLKMMIDQFRLLSSKYAQSDSVHLRCDHAARSFLFNVLENIIIDGLVTEPLETCDALTKLAHASLQGKHCVTLFAHLLEGKNEPLPKTTIQSLAFNLLTASIHIEEQQFELAFADIKAFEALLKHYVLTNQHPPVAVALAQALTSENFPAQTAEKVKAFITYLASKPFTIDNEEEHRKFLQQLQDCVLVATENDNLLLVSLLRIWGVVLNAQNKFGHQAIHIAASRDLVDIVSLLLKNLDINVRNIAGNSPLHYAALAGSSRVLALLLRKKADINAQNTLQQTPLLLSIMEDKLSAARSLLAEGASVQLCDYQKKLPMHYVAEYGRDAFVLPLLQVGASIDALDYEECTPIQRADKVGRKNIVYMIRDTADGLKRAERLQHRDKLMKELSQLEAEWDNQKKILKDLTAISPAKLLALRDKQIKQREQPNAATQFRLLAMDALFLYPINVETQDETCMVLTIMHVKVNEETAQELLKHLFTCITKVLPDWILTSTMHSGLQLVIRTQKSQQTHILQDLFTQAGLTITSKSPASTLTI